MDENKIRQLIKQEIETSQNEALYSITSSAAHTHNGVDSPKLPYLTLFGSTIPTLLKAPKGTLYVNTVATTTTTRVFVNTTGGASWASFTTSA